eukprot:CAMPEP_0119047780 /NCGR_PEP_ID=MMETSP1177-20130426/54931_1 /TAXON_ID=2985 /ORGANISM="Ochromonas sp, Strain CCMP1899" /LENGTH=122 /DNA_ID=CAMNT_0007022763 /DNA_START=355 /DNA_END=720 /DNA_ORIENTATION=+
MTAKETPTVQENLDSVDNTAAELEKVTSEAKQLASSFQNATNDIAKMFDYRAKMNSEKEKERQPKDRAPKRRHRDTGKPFDEMHEKKIEKVRKERYSVTIKPQEGFKSFAELQAAGREGPGG